VNNLLPKPDVEDTTDVKDATTETVHTNCHALFPKLLSCCLLGPQAVGVA